MLKYLIILVMSSALYAQESLPNIDLSSPRGTFKTFLKSMVMVKENKQVNRSYQIAFRTLDTSHFDPATRDISSKRVADQLIGIFDRAEKIDYEKIPEKVDQDVWTYTSFINETLIELELKKNKEEKWLFSKSTVNKINSLYNQVKNTGIVNGVVALDNIILKIQAKMPEWTAKKFLFIKVGQWIALSLLLLLALLIKKIINYLYIRFIVKYLKIVSVPKNKIQKIAEPLGVITAISFIVLMLPLLNFSDSVLAFWTRALYIALSLLFIWFGLNIVNLIALMLAKWASNTETKADDILIPLIEKTLKGFVVVIGILFIAHSAKINVANMLAGLGIGAMAFAFAAKDTLANFFGSLMIVLDRPFDIGDYISVEGMDGTVEEVGFRSTRIRSFQDSIISIPNGQLANININNFGRRRFRRNDIALGVEYDTDPDLMEKFCQKIKDTISAKTWLKDDQYLVYFDSFGDFSLNIKVRVYIITNDFAAECEYKHELLMELLKLGNGMGVSFAFPTQTVHLKK